MLDIGAESKLEARYEITLQKEIQRQRKWKTLKETKRHGD